MSRLDELPPDQRAALSLLLRQRKSYAEVAKLLGIPEHAVADRAQVALAVLATRQARDLTPERRKEIGDYLLGQQPGVAERLRTRTLLSSSEPAHAWASAVASQLAPLADANLPDIPPVAPGAGAPQTLQDLSAASAAAAAPPSGPAPVRPARSSKLGGAIVLAVLVAAVVVAVVLLSGGSSGKKSSTTSSTSSTSAKTGPTVENQISLKPPTGVKSASVGVVDVLAEAGKRAFFIEAQHVPASKGFYYAIWLYNSPHNALALSKSPAVGSTHRLAGGSLLPAAAADYREILLTRETTAHPKQPGRVVLRGPFSLTG
ncbi:MAG TPA: sigma-70 region 4 domain-containing protein [Solirubrobacteraceae bacterium]